MAELPDDSSRAELIDELGALVERHGAEPLLLPPLLPSSRWFPDPWAPDVTGATAVARRLLSYAGLGEYHAAVGCWADQPSILRKRGFHAPDGGVAACFLGLEGTVAHFAVEESHLDDPEAVVAALAHEVAHAWREARGEHVEDSLGEEELTDLTTVYLGFGVLTANAAYRLRRWGYAAGAYAHTATSQLQLGYLGPGPLSFLLACQAVARGAGWRERRRVAAQLEPYQQELFTKSVGVLRGNAAALQRRLGGPSESERPEPRPLPDGSPGEVIRARADDLPSAAAERWNTGRPVFRVLAKSDALARLASPVVYAIGGGVPAMIVGGLVGDTSGARTGMAWGAAIGAVAGIWFGAIRRPPPSDTCSDMGCRADLPRGATTCLTCGGTIAGEIRTIDDRMDAEERYGQDDGLAEEALASGHAAREKAEESSADG